MFPNGVQSLISNKRGLFVCFLEFCLEILSAKLSNSVEFLLRIYLEMMDSIVP